MEEIKESRKAKLIKLGESMRAIRLPHEATWQDEDYYILPGEAMLQNSENNRGERQDEFIIDETCTLAARTGSSGFVAGMTSPARPWVRITVEDKTIAEQCRWWCDEVSELILTSLSKSNVYDTLAQLYEHEFVFGQSPMLVEEDFENVIHTWTFPPGRYWIAEDSKRRVNVFRREFQMTVRQIVDDFGRPDGPHGPIDWTNISANVRSLWTNKNTEEFIDVVHFIYPNDDYRKDAMESRYKKFASCYYEQGTGENNVFLRESGYDYFPVLCPRWAVSGTTPYATKCPGKTALGSVKSLQQMHKEKARAIQVGNNPPLNAPASMRHKVVTSIPGTVNWMDPTAGNQKVEPTFTVDPKIQEMREEIRACQQMIRRTFFEDLFLMIIDDPRVQPPTAEEIRARQQEKLLAVGPVLERNNRDLLAPLIEIVFMMLARQNKIPDPPPALQGRQLKIEYLSVMAQAQKAAGLGSMDRLLDVVARVGALNPAAFDKFDFDQYLDEYADRTGAPARIIIPDDRVAAIRHARAEAEQAQRAAAMIPPAAESIKKLSEAKLGEGSVLDELAQRSQAGSLVPAA